MLESSGVSSSLEYENTTSHWEYETEIDKGERVQAF